MRQIRLFTHNSLEVGTTIELEDNLKHHLDKVLRFKKDMSLTLFNGDGFDYHGVLTHLDRRQALILVKSRKAVFKESDINMTLYFAMLKGDIMDRVVQKSVELGVQTLVLLKTKHTEVSFNPSRLESKMTHWQNIIYASSQQCGRAKIMALVPPMDFDEAIRCGHSQRWLFSPHHQPKENANNVSKLQDIGLMIGPEGGFHVEEVNQALANQWQPKSLGARILRADTAAISAVLLAQFQFSHEFQNA